MTFSLQQGGNPAPAPWGAGGTSAPGAGAPLGGTGATPNTGAAAATPGPAPFGASTAAPAGGFSFSAAAPATGATTGGTVFQGNTSTTATNLTTAAPPATGFTVPAASAGNAPAAGNAPTGAPTGASLFGNPTGTTAPAGGLFATGTTGFGASTSTLGGFGGRGGLSTPGTAGTQPFQVSDYEDIFPGHVLWEKVYPLAEKARKGDSLAGQELKQILSPDDSGSLGSHLLKLDEIWKLQERSDENLRNQLRQTNGLLIRGKEVSFDQARREDVFRLATELFLPERAALSLYAHTERIMPGADIAAVREFYMEERSQFLKTLLYLIQTRQLANDGSLYLQATDGLLRKGLIMNLFNYIRKCSELVIAFGGHVTQGSSAMVSTRSYWKFAMQERQRAAECVFFIAYHTQMEVHEISDLVDVIQGLTNSGQGYSGSGMPDLDPFDDAPSAYDQGDQHSMHIQYGWLSGMHQRKEKDPSTWRFELVDQCLLSGQTHLLRCVSILLVAGITALDTNLVFVDRNTHASNSFGKGNALVPQDTSGALNHLTPLDSKFNQDSTKRWQRLDVFGILLASYGLLLKAFPSALTSPRSGSSAGPSVGLWSPQEIRRRRGETLDYPTQWRSFTFGRLCVVPGVAVPSHSAPFRICDTEPFALDILCGFMARYLEAIAASPPVSREKWLVDAQEDLRFRQQDEAQKREFHQWSGTTATQTEHVPTSVDILERPDCMDDIVAFCVAVGCRGPSIAFWDVKRALLPSNAMCRMDKLRIDDLTLRGPYFDFLAILDIAQGQEDSGQFDGAEKIHTLLSTQSVNPDYPIDTTWADVVDVIRYYARYLVDKENMQASPQTSSSNGGQSMVYYYFNDDSFGSRKSQSSKKSSSSSKPRLDAEGAHLLSAGLSLLEAVASRSSNARVYLRNLSLPVESSDGVLGRDSTLLVLFTLATAPIAPEIRGLAFSVIAAILNDCTQEEAQNAWSIMESSGFLPIYKLQQYPTEIGENDVPGIGFPTALTAQVREKAGASPIPADPKFSMVFEMEYIENIEGSYPSTAGFLALVNSLVKNGGCPPNLGHNWRARAGCSPYVEYAMDYVIRRALGSFDPFPALSFRSSAEKNRLCGAALELIKTVASLYVVPYESSGENPFSLSHSFEKSKLDATKLLGFTFAADLVVAAPKEQDFAAYVQDFFQGSSSSGNFHATALPAPKSPGFTVLFRSFQSHQNSLCPAMATLLSTGDIRHPSEDTDALQLSLALFGRLRPSFESCKRGKSQQSSKLSKLLVDLRMDGPIGRYRAQDLRQHALSNILQIFCILACREEAFRTTLAKARVEHMVPTLRFSTKPGPPEVWVLNFSGIRTRLKTFGVSDAVVSCIDRFDDYLLVPSFATVLLYLLKDTSNVLPHQKVISRALAKLIDHLSSIEPLPADASGLFTFALQGLLDELRNEQPGSLVSSATVQPILDSLKNAVASVDFLVGDSARVAMLCFQTIVLLHRKYPIQAFPHEFFLECLANLKHFILHAASGQAPRDIMESVAWVLTGIADHLLDSHGGSSAGLSVGSSEKHATIRKLIEGRELDFLLQHLPLDDAGHAAALSNGIHLCLSASILAAAKAGYVLPLGDVVSTLLNKLCENLDETTLRNLALCLYTSVDHTEIPTNAILDVASAICDAIVNGYASKPLLVAALILTLAHMDTSVQSLAEDRIDKMLDGVSKSLFVMSRDVSTSFPPAPSSEALTARTALKLLFNSASEGAIHRVLLGMSYLTAKQTHLEELISLVSNLDQDMPNLLSAIGRFPFGGKLLLQSGILSALLIAARGFHNLLESHRQQFPSASIDAPAFLLDHLQLVNCVLINGLDGIEENVRRDATSQVLELLKFYDPIISQLIRSYPSDLDLTGEYFRCLAIVQSVLGHVPLYPGRQSELKVMIPQFVFGLLENPVPKAFRGPVPSLLMRSHIQPVYGLTRTETSEKTWWDLAKERTPTMIGQDGICFWGNHAAEIALAGLRFIEGADGIPSVDPVTVGRSLIAAADSILYLDRYSVSSQDAIESARVFRERLVWIIAELLRISFRIAQNVDQSHRAVARLGIDGVDISAVLLAALDRAKLHTLKKFSPSDSDQSDENILDELALKLYDRLR